jgi:hypothetical protein
MLKIISKPLNQFLSIQLKFQLFTKKKIIRINSLTKLVSFIFAKSPSGKVRQLTNKLENGKELINFYYLWPKGLVILSSQKQKQALRLRT